MRSRGVWLAVAGVVAVAVGFVVLGLVWDASFFGVAAIVAAVAFGAAMVGLFAVLMSLVGTVQELTRTVEQITEHTIPLLSGVNETVAGVNTELARLDSVVASVQHISGTAEGIADVIHAAVANPLIKAIAFATGTGAALRGAKAAKRATDPDQKGRRR